MVKERSEIHTAVANLSVGRIVMPAAMTLVNGGTIVESLARPMISQKINQSSSEKRIGTFLPNRIISSNPLA